MPIGLPSYNLPGFTPTTDPYAAQRAAAAGAAKSASASSAAASANPYYNPSAQAGAMAKASNMAPTSDPNMILDPTTGQYRYLTAAEISDRARSQGGGMASNAGAMAANAAGNAQQQAQYGAMNTASTMAAAPYGVPMPSTQGPQAGTFQAPYNTWENAQAYANPYAFNLPQSPGAASWTGAQGYQDPYSMNIPGYGLSNPMGNQQATLENIKPYLDPNLGQIISQGTNAIAHSGAARGLFGSTGNINDIGNWATNAASKAYGDAMNAFNADRGYFNNLDWSRYNAGADAGNTAWNRYANDRNFLNDNAWRGYDAGTAAGADALNRAAGDRGYLTDQYWNNRNADTSDFWNTYNANWNQYKYGDAAYRGILGDYYGANKDINSSEQGAANSIGALYAALGNSLAGLYGDSGNAAAAGGVAGANANQSFIGTLLGALAML